jgi:hypothetical protein
MGLWSDRWSRRAAGAVVAVLGASAFIVMSVEQPLSQQQRPQGVIQGTVTGPGGPEGGVWVIAETSDLPTKFVKIVVTDEQGRYVLPEMPNANYSIWIRGYGLADSKPVAAKPGQTVALTAVKAASAAEAAKVYPANYWYSMLEVPAESDFPGTGADGNGISPIFRLQAQFIDQLKQGCQLCHQLGNQVTRTLTHMNHLGFKTSLEAWDYRVKTGQRGPEMDGMMQRLGPRALRMYADWTDRIAKGELPAMVPPRPKGAERNVVVTMWDWGNETSYMHDEIATTKSNPRMNANGPVYAVDAAHGKYIAMNPLENSAYEIPIPTRDDPKTMRSRFPQTQIKPSNFWGQQIVHSGVSDPHNPMMDRKGRLWSTSTVSQGPVPDWCKDGSVNKFAAYFPATSRSNRHASFFDPQTGKHELIYTCFGTHHLQFGEDENEMLYFSGGGATVPWVNAKVYDQTHDEKQAVGWCPTVLDTNGDGKITKPWNEPVGGGRSQEEGGGGGRPGTFDPKLDTRVNAGSYGIIVSPADGSVWTASTSYPGRIVRLDIGKNPPETCISEMYTVPNDKAASHFGPRGIDIDRNGVVWMALSGSGGFASFDRRKCKVFKGPEVAEGQQCNEGWSFYPLKDGLNLKGTKINADFHYYNWVDQFNTGGFGENTPIATGSGSDSLLVLDRKSGDFTTLRVPYPLGFYSRGLDGRIDDPNAGWKGRALWANYGTNFLWHIEGGKGMKSKIVRFQVRPDPLAR